MKEYVIQNSQLTLTASTEGGLLQGIRRADGKELIWGGDPAVWASHAPVCFPWCGKLQDEWYELDGERHEAHTRHGFVRDNPHQLVAQSGSEMTFRFDHPGDAVWPWAFTFRTTHKVEGKKAFTICTVVNRSERPMPTQMGFHPAFVCPFVEGSGIEEYRVRFASGKVVPLEPHLFDEDSMTIEGGGDWARLEHVPTGKYIEVDNKGWFNTLLWSKPGIPGFVCIEPWSGFLGATHDLSKRPGAVLLAPGESKTWTLTMDFSHL